jgi:ubiquinone biosynthesis protein COQ4
MGTDHNAWRAHLDARMGKRVGHIAKRMDRVYEKLGLDAQPIIQIEALRALPIGTLGKTWAEALDSQGIEPLTHGPRIRQLHDGIHVLTGYGTDIVGEAHVAAFNLGTKLRPFTLLIGSAILLGLLRRNGSVPWASLKQAYERGRNSQLNCDTWKPEHEWDIPLAAVRQRYGL